MLRPETMPPGGKTKKGRNVKKLIATASVIALIGVTPGGLAKAEPLDAKIDSGGNAAILVLAESGDAPNAAFVRDALVMSPALPASDQAPDPERQAMAGVFAKLLMLATVAGAEPVARLAVTGR